MSSVETVDIIIPNFNKAIYIEETIQSVIDQKFDNWKLYIIDNNSSDGSIKILKKFDNFKNKIKIIYLKRNKGAYFSRNLGLRISSSKYVCFLDSDDIWKDDKLEKQVDFMNKKNCNFSYTNYVPFKIENNKKVFKKEISPPNHFSYNSFLRNTSIGTSTVMINREFFKDIKFPKVPTFEDYIYKCNLLKKSEAIKLNYNTTYYRILKKSLSSNRLKNIYWLYVLTKNYNKLSLLKNIFSILFVGINSIKKYGIK